MCVCVCVCVCVPEFTTVSQCFIFQNSTVAAMVFLFFAITDLVKLEVNLSHIFVSVTWFPIKLANSFNSDLFRGPIPPPFSFHAFIMNNTQYWLLPLFMINIILWWHCPKALGSAETFPQPTYLRRWANCLRKVTKSTWEEKQQLTSYLQEFLSHVWPSGTLPLKTGGKKNKLRPWQFHHQYSLYVKNLMLDSAQY